MKKSVTYDYTKLASLSLNISSLESCVIMGKEDSSDLLKENFISSTNKDLMEYKNYSGDIVCFSMDAFIDFFKTYKSYFKKMRKYKVPSWLKKYYNLYVDEVNKLIDEAREMGYFTRHVKKI